MLTVRGAQDYPYILDREPDFSIFQKDVVLQDLQGFSIRGKQVHHASLNRLERPNRSKIRLESLKGCWGLGQEQRRVAGQAFFLLSTQILFPNHLLKY